MTGRRHRMLCILGVALTTIAMHGATAQGGPGCCPPPSPASSQARTYGRGATDASHSRPPEPYRGQQRCPVCGGALGANGTPESVDTTFTTPTKKTIWQKIGLAPASTEKVAYFVCGGGCAAEAQKEPNKYLISVIAGGSGGR